MCRAFFIPPRQWERCPFSETGGRSRRFTPHMWGKFVLLCGLGDCVRFTPTCVGKMYKPDGRPNRKYGSPPRAWGKSINWPGFPPTSRFTPTCVGKMTKRWPRPFGRAGSPPRAWGKWALGLGKFVQIRFTPTCVGKILKSQKINLSPLAPPYLGQLDKSPPYRLPAALASGKSPSEIPARSARNK